MKNTETITISRTEYNELVAAKAHASELSQQVQYLLEQMKLARKKQFGSATEQSKYDSPDQLNLFNEAEYFWDKNIIEAELVEVETHYRKKRKETKDNLPEEFPIETIECILTQEEQDCSRCGGMLHVMGKEVARRELKIIPAKVSIVEYIRYTYSCRNCEKNDTSVPVIKAPVPKAVIRGGFASPEAVAHIMTQKFVMGSPLYRQEQEFKRQAIMLSRQTMSNWLLKCSADWLNPVYERMHELLLTHKVLHGDESPCRFFTRMAGRLRQKATCGCTEQAATQTGLWYCMNTNPHAALSIRKIF